MPFQPFNPNDAVHSHRGNLPHWRQWGTTYFVTFRLGDSLPASVQRQWRERRNAWLNAHGRDSVQELEVVQSFSSNSVVLTHRRITS